jgi:hypothetical protein
MTSDQARALEILRSIQQTGSASRVSGGIEPAGTAQEDENRNKNKNSNSI